MAKKHRQRTWYIALFQEESDKAFLHRRLPNNAVLFDSENIAYSYALNRRLTPIRDENDKLILDEKGYAQLPNLGKLTVVGVKGKALDWKQVEKAPKDALRQMGFSADAIGVKYNVPLNKVTLESVMEETDEMYNKFANSALAKAGGVKPLGDITTEILQSQAELGTDSTHS